MSSYDQAIEKFDAYNSQDPNTEMAEGKPIARELLYAKRMSQCLSQFAPDAREEIRLAARCQHIGRWQIPRNTYPEGKKGYLIWRTKLRDLHAEIAGNILRSSGYGDPMVEKVRFLLLKKELYQNAGTQLLEDVVCLVFVKYYLTDFAKKHEPAKVIDILRKTLKKMSRAAQTEAMGMPLDEGVRVLVEKAAE